MRIIFSILLLWVICFSTAYAHEVRPAYLRISEVKASEFSVSWKQPVTDGKRLKIKPEFPQGCVLGEPLMRLERGAVTEQFTVSCDLRSGEIMLSGLERTLTDIFVQISYLDGTTASHLVKPSATAIPLGGGASNAAPQYLSIGVTHILSGWDHLLFVLGLTLLIGGRKIWAVATGFTVAHSITLGLAAFNVISVPATPVEILIAASIVVLAVELIRKADNPHTQSLTLSRPYIVAFIIGLIHGCGFAGALTDIGLPKSTELLALFLFNIGVELGQFAVIALILLIVWGATRLFKLKLDTFRIFAAYIIGPIAVFWVLQRSAALISVIF